MFLPSEVGEHLYGYLELCDKLCLEAWEHICRSLGVALLLVPPNLFAVREISKVSSGSVASLWVDSEG